MKAILLIALAGFCAALAGPVPAQTGGRGAPTLPPPEKVRSLHIAGHNQLGLLQYCRQRGLISDEAVERQRRLLAALPPAPDGELGAAEEVAGRDGLIAFDGNRASFAVDAAAQGISLAYNCQQIALRVAAQAESRR